MSLIITDECIACDACVEECPNFAIEPDDPIYVIDSDRCTECIEHGGEPACIPACPVDCIISDSNNVESAKELTIKAKNLAEEE